MKISDRTGNLCWPSEPGEISDNSGHKKTALIVSCEHATNHIPDEFAPLFHDRGDELLTHRGYDQGAYEFARLLAKEFEAPLFAGSVSRLLVELNRSLTNRRSSPTKALPGIIPAVREQILRRFYHPYRQAIEQAVAEACQKCLTTLHLSIHSFAPVLNGVERSADIGFLYDPARRTERSFCDKWLRALAAKGGDLRLRRNYPYRGISDGMVTSLRKRYDAEDYHGIELEINQLFPQGSQTKWLNLQRQLLDSLTEVLRPSR